MNKGLDIGLAISFIAAALLIAHGGAKIYDVIKGDTNCVYCHNQIKNNSDVVIFSDGRRAHLECAWRERGESNDT